MQTLDDAIEDLIRRKIVDPSEAFERAIQKERFVQYLRSVPEEYREMLGDDSATNSNSTRSVERMPTSGRPASRSQRPTRPTVIGSKR